MNDYPASRDAVERARSVIPGGAQTGLRQQAYEAGPIAFDGASGSTLTTVDGTTLTDYHLAFGPIILGHGYPAVDRAAKDMIDTGVLYGAGTTPIESEVAEQLVDLIPSVELVNFCNSGTEATYHAIRLARAYTGGSTLIKFQGCYHGWHDYVSLDVYPPADRLEGRYLESAGVLREAVDRTISLPFNDPDAIIAAIDEHEADLAGVILEPIPHSVGALLPTDEFLETLREETDRRDVPLIFDEVISAFRHNLRGVQSDFGVIPDLTCMAKAMGNGYPVAAVGGRRDIMEQADTTTSDSVVISGTYSGHPVSLAAARATLQTLEDTGGIDEVAALGDRYRAGLRELLEDRDITGRVVGFRSIFGLQFGVTGEPRSYRDVAGLDSERFGEYARKMRDRGHFFTSNPYKRHHLSFAHDDTDCESYLADADAVLATL